MTKQTIDQLEAGDQVVIDRGQVFGGDKYVVRVVDKVTATQITVDGARYNKRTGTKIGESQYSRYPQEIARVDHGRKLMTPEEAREHNQAIARARQVREMAQKIAEVGTRKLVGLGEEKLRQIMSLMEIE